MYKTDNQQEPTTQHKELYSIFKKPIREYNLEKIDAYVCTLETNSTGDEFCFHEQQIELGSGALPSNAHRKQVCSHGNPPAPPQPPASPRAAAHRPRGLHNPSEPRGQTGRGVGSGARPVLFPHSALLPPFSAAMAAIFV